MCGRVRLVRCKREGSKLSTSFAGASGCDGRVVLDCADGKARLSLGDGASCRATVSRR